MDSQDVTNLKKQLREQGYNIYVHSHPAGMCFPEHKHDHHTLHVILSGSMNIRVDGKEHVLESGDQIEIPANILHTAEVGETPVVCIDARK